MPLSLLQLTKPVFDMLDRVTAIGTDDLANAQALVANVSSSVQKMSDSIQSATMDKIDSFQSSYLGKSANSSADDAGNSTTDRLVRAVHAVYYVSLHGASACDCTRQLADTQQLCCQAGKYQVQALLRTVHAHISHLLLSCLHTPCFTSTKF
jgi:hypothetical protein